MEENKKNNSLLWLLLSVMGIPFVVTLYKVFTKGLDEPATMKDLLAIFGFQVLAIALLIIYLVLFFHPYATI